MREVESRVDGYPHAFDDIFCTSNAASLHNGYYWMYAAVIEKIDIPMHSLTHVGLQQKSEIVIGITNVISPLCSFSPIMSLFAC